MYSKFRSTKPTKDLSNLPLVELYHKYSEADKAGRPEVLRMFINTNSIASKSDWFFPQMLAKFAEVPVARNATGLIDGNSFTSNLDTLELRSLFLLAKYSQRGEMLKAQTTLANREYSSLVPLILAAHKKYNNVPYSDWDPSTLHLVVEKNLCEAMLSDIPEVTKEEILAIREYGLTVKSGATAGSIRNPETTYSLYIGKDTPISDLPTLAKIMLCQTWCAHPNNRSKYAILNPVDWDGTPEDLVTVEVKKPLATTSIVSWMDM